MASGPPRTRLAADDRRRQLVGIGLRLLIDRPIHALSIDEVAAEAGISRSLLFHHFPSKRAYYAAVVEAGFRRMLRATDPPPDTAPAERLHHLVAGLVTFIERRREPYVALVRGAAGGDEWIQRIIEDTRAELVDRTLAALRELPATAAGDPPADDALLRLTVRGWLAYAEEVTLAWSAVPDRRLTRSALTVQLIDALRALLACPAPERPASAGRSSDPPAAAR